MATRFYLHAATNSTTGLPSAEQSSLTSEGDFEGSQTTNRQMTTSLGAAQASLARNTLAGDVNSHNYYCSRWVSPPLYQYSLSAQTWTYNFAAQEAGASTNFPVSGNNGPVRVNCYVWRPSNSSKVGTILDGNTASTVDEATSGEVVHHVTFGGSAVANMDFGDVIIFEAWFIVDPATGGNNTAMTFYYDGTTANTTDNASGVTNHASFIETPETLQLAVLTRVNQTYTHIWNIKNLVQAPSLLFDGSDDNIDCGSHTDLWSQGLTKFSLSFWIYPTAGWDTNRRVVIEHSSGNAHGFVCEIHPTTANQIEFMIKDSGNVEKRVNSNGVFTLNAWNLITCVYDNSLGSANVKIYVGTTVGGTTANLTETVNRSAVLRLANATTDFKGNMKGFRFYKSIALDSTQITNILNNSDSAPTPDYWLKMNENTGTPVDFIAGKTTTATGTSWEARSPPSLSGKTFTHKYNIKNLIAQTYTHKYNIKNLINKTYTHIYNILAVTSTVAQTYTHKYNIRNLAAQTYTHKYNIRTLINKTYTHKYNIKNLISKTFTHKWNIRNLVNSTFTHRYNIRNLVNKTFTHKWNIINFAAATFTHRYNIRNLINKTYTHRYNIKALIAQTYTHKYNIKNLISKTYTHKYNIKTLIAQTYTHKYGIKNLVAQTYTHLYSILSEILTASNTFTHVYNIKNLTNQSYTHKYSIKNLIASIFTHRYNILTIANETYTHKYNIRNLIAKTFTHKYNIRNLATKLFTHRYNIRNLVNQTFTHIYNILTVGLVSMSYTHRYNIRNLTAKTYTHRWNILQVVNQTFTHLYNITQTINQTFTHRYNILNLVNQTFTHFYNILEVLRASNTFTHRYNIRNLASKTYTHRYNIKTLATILVTKIKDYLVSKYQENDPSI